MHPIRAILRLGLIAERVEPRRVFRVRYGHGTDGDQRAQPQAL